MIHLFELELPLRTVDPPLRDLVKVLTFPCGPTFEPLSSQPLRVVTVKVMFLLALATAKRVGELQAISFHVAFRGDDLSLSYLPEFAAKTESEKNPIPHSFVVRSMSQFVGDLPEERLLCPVCAVRVYLDLTSSISLHPRSLFVSPRRPSHSLSKNTLSFFLRRVIMDADTLWEGSSVTLAHSIRGVATCVAFLRDWSVSKVLEAATWRSNLVFALFYFCDLSYSLDGCNSLGPFSAAGSVINCFSLFCIHFSFVSMVVYLLLRIGFTSPPCGSYVFSLDWLGHGF